MNDIINLKNIQLSSKKLFFTLNQGMHNSFIHGSGYEFSELRTYEIGDDIRYIDHTQSAKHNQPIVKLYLQEGELDVFIVGIISGSLYFGTDEFKYEKMARLGYILSTLAINNSDSFSGFLGEEELLVCTKKSKKTQSVLKFTHEILTTTYLHKKPHYQNIIQTITKLAKNNSIIFLMGDFLDMDLDLSLLKKFDTRICIIRDRFEEKPEISGNINLIDNTSKTYIYTNISQKEISNYTTNLKLNDNKLYEHCTKLGFKYAKFYTNENELLSLKEILS